MSANRQELQPAHWTLNSHRLKQNSAVVLLDGATIVANPMSSIFRPTARVLVDPKSSPPPTYSREKLWDVSGNSYSSLLSQSCRYWSAELHTEKIYIIEILGTKPKVEIHEFMATLLLCLGGCVYRTAVSPHGDFFSHPAASICLSKPFVKCPISYHKPTDTLSNILRVLSPTLEFSPP